MDFGEWERRDREIEGEGSWEQHLLAFIIDRPVTIDATFTWTLSSLFPVDRRLLVFYQSEHDSMYIVL